MNQSINKTHTFQINKVHMQSTAMDRVFSEMADFLLYHLITIVIISLIGLAMAVSYYGSKKNLQIATRTRNVMDGFMRSNFSNYSGELIQEAPHVIKLYASGREGCIFGIFAFALIPRQQLLSFFFNFLLFNLKDQLVIQIPIKSPSVLPLTLAIVRKKNIRQITKKKYPDIKNLCKQYRPTNKQAINVPETHAILVQKKQHVQYLLSGQKDVNTWTQYGKSIKMVYLSDVNRFSRYPMALRVVINLTQEDLFKSSGKGFLAILDWIMSFVDRISKLKMSVIDKRQAKKKRQGIVVDLDQF